MRDTRIEIRISEAEREAFERVAAALGQTIGAAVRLVMLEKDRQLAKAKK